MQRKALRPSNPATESRTNTNTAAAVSPMTNSQKAILPIKGKADSTRYAPETAAASAKGPKGYSSVPSGSGPGQLT